MVNAYNIQSRADATLHARTAPLQIAISAAYVLRCTYIAVGGGRGQCVATQKPSHNAKDQLALDSHATLDS